MSVRGAVKKLQRNATGHLVASVSDLLLDNLLIDTGHRERDRTC